jgi:UDP-N-acetylglucosamine 4,6-dehydratase
VDLGQYEPWEFLSTNVTGTYNVIHAAIINGVQQIVTLSSDKSVFPINLYGASKMAAEYLTVQANHYSPHGTRLCATRYGNVMGARGSVVKVWREALAAGKPIFLTDEHMSRFWMSIDEAVRLVVWTAIHGLRGGIAIPHLPAFKMIDLATALCPSRVSLIGKRPGEKLAEYLLTDDEQERCYWYGPSDKNLVCYVIPPLLQRWGSTDERALWEIPPVDMAYGTIAPAHQVPYRSDTWRWQLDVDELRARLAKLQ